jgi:hypothetical protein
MIAWENDLLTGGTVIPGTTGRAAAARREEPLDGQTRAWRARLWRDLVVAMALYGIAHLLFSMRWMAGGNLVVTLDLGLAQVLIVVGTLLLWKVTHALNEPRIARRPDQGRYAAWCLAVATALSFSPSIWWFIFRA